MLPVRTSAVGQFRMDLEYQNALDWFRLKGPQFANGFLYGCGAIRKFLWWCGFEDAELAAASIVVKE